MYRYIIILYNSAALKQQWCTNCRSRVVKRGWQKKKNSYERSTEITTSPRRYAAVISCNGVGRKKQIDQIGKSFCRTVFFFFYSRVHSGPTNLVHCLRGNCQHPAIPWKPRRRCKRESIVYYCVSANLRRSDYDDYDTQRGKSARKYEYATNRPDCGDDNRNRKTLVLPPSDTGRKLDDQHSACLAHYWRSLFRRCRRGPTIRAGWYSTRTSWRHEDPVIAAAATYTLSLE